MKEVLNASLFVTGAAIISMHSDIPACGSSRLWTGDSRGKGRPYRFPPTECCMRRIDSVRHSLTSPTTARTKPKYRFRFRSAETGQETNGAGRVCLGAIKWRPNRCPTSVTMGTSRPFVVDVVECRTKRLDVYYHSNRTHVAVLNNAEFTAFDFGHGTLNPYAQEALGQSRPTSTAGLYVVSVILSL